jgi:hypothetical protein
MPVQMLIRIAQAWRFQREAGFVLTTRGRSRAGLYNGRTRGFLLAPVKKAPSVPASLILR